MSTPLGEFEQVVLFSVLRLGDGAYGLAIADSIESRTGRSVSPGAIYTTLGRLADRGVVSARIEAARQGPGRRRKFYQLTPDGARLLRASWGMLRAAADGMAGRLDDLVGEDA